MEDPRLRQDTLPPNSFFSGGYKYTLDVRLIYVDNDGSEGVIYLQSDCIDDIEITTSLNRMYSEGFILYNDKFGNLGRITQYSERRCHILFRRSEVQNNGIVGSEKASGPDFSHMFIVDNVKIDETGTDSGPVIPYTIKLTGIEYESLLNRVEYSNLDKTGDEMPSLVQTLSEVIREHKVLETDESFSKVGSGVKVPYVSNVNDNVMTAAKYLLHRQFFFPENVDDGIKFLTYDIISGKYGIFSKKSLSRTKVYPVILQFNGTEMELFIQNRKILLLSSSKMRKSDILNSLSRIQVMSYDPKTNDIVPHDYSSKRIISFFLGGESYGKDSRLRDVDNTDYQRSVSEWDNDTNVYQDFVDLFMGFDSLVVNLDGVQERKLMDIVEISIDDRADKSGQISKNMTEFNRQMNRNSQIKGRWFVTEIRHIIKPSQRDGTYKQNLRLSRMTV
jgi:hypothetical protein